jgi:hypothetical protein
MVSKKLRSLQYREGFWGWLLTFSILNNIHRITATAANSAVDITATVFSELNITNTVTDFTGTAYLCLVSTFAVPLRLWTTLVTSSKHVSDNECGHAWTMFRKSQNGIWSQRQFFFSSPFLQDFMPLPACKFTTHSCRLIICDIYCGLCDCVWWECELYLPCWH